MTVTHNARAITVAPRIEQIVLYLIAHQAQICQMPVCALEFYCGLGREVKGKLKVELVKPEKLLDF